MYKIAFFGSDAFSHASFKAVLNLHRTRPDVVRELALVTRKLKVSGRGMKNIVKPAIVEHAESEGIKWHEIETREQFESLTDISNLAVAVSYGRLIPGSYLNSLKYGGLNVHPSLLPQYRGSSPLQWAIMDRQNVSGVSVQTLHPTKFDHGQVLWQSPPVPLDARETTDTLSPKLAQIGAQGLCEVLLTHDLLADHHTPAAAAPAVAATTTTTIKPSKAPMIDKHLFQIDFSKPAAEIDARGRALGKLWFEQRVEQKVPKRGKPKGHPQIRVNLSNFEPVAEVAEPVAGTESNLLARGTSPDGTDLLCLRLGDGEFIGASQVTVQGFKTESASAYFTEMEKRRLRDVLVTN